MFWNKRYFGLFAVIACLCMIIAPLKVDAVSTSNAITREGSKLLLNGKPYSFTGVNAYELATDWSINEGCGGMLSDTQMDAFFGSLRPHSVVRFWVFQDLATNKTTETRDWTAIDRVFKYAEKNNQFLLPVIGNHWPECDGGTAKNDAWYNGGYKKPFTPDGKQRVSYISYLKEVLNIPYTQ